jgi:hypothetical protein
MMRAGGFRLWRLTFLKAFAGSAHRRCYEFGMRRNLSFVERTSADERRAALSYVTEAFAEAILDGIEADCFAHAALFTALQELVATYGEDQVALFAEKLPERVRHGEFSGRAKQ